MERTSQIWVRFVFILNMLISTINTFNFYLCNAVEFTTEEKMDIKKRQDSRRYYTKHGKVLPTRLVLNDIDNRWQHHQEIKTMKSGIRKFLKENTAAVVSVASAIAATQLPTEPASGLKKNTRKIKKKYEKVSSQDETDQKLVQENAPEDNFNFNFSTSAVESAIDSKIVDLARKTFIQDLYESASMMENHAHMLNTIYVPDHIMLNVKSLKLWLNGVSAQFSGIYSNISIEHFTKSVLNQIRNRAWFRCYPVEHKSNNNRRPWIFRLDAIKQYQNTWNRRYYYF